MRKLGWFIGLSVAVVIAFSIATNWNVLWKAMLSLPLDRVVCYLGGAGTMLAANFLGGSTKKITPPSSNTAKKA